MVKTRTQLEVPVLTTAAKARQQARHADTYAQLNHQMTEAAAEASAGLITHAVPVVYGALMGSLIGHPLFGLSLGIVASVVMDLRLNEQSALRPGARAMLRRFCRGHARQIDGVLKKHVPWARPLVDSVCKPSGSRGKRRLSA